jgi:thiol:disulfide interchange protein
MKKLFLLPYMKKFCLKLLLCLMLFLPMMLRAQELPFVWKSQAKGNTFTVTVEIAPGHYFYRSTLILDIQGNNGKVLYPVTLPPAQVVADDMFGKVEVYPAGTWKWVFESDGPIVKASVNYQGCRKATADEAAMCFMPETVNLLAAVNPLAQAEAAGTLLPERLDGFRFERKLTGLHSKSSFLAWLDGKNETPVSDGNSAGMGFFALALLALLGGLGLNLTPCVLPMLPITLAIIGAGGTSGRKGFFRGLLYGSGMAAAYGILGLAVILAGARFGNLQSSMYFNFAIALIFFLLGLAMLGVLNLDFSGATAKIRPGRFSASGEITAFVMGGVSALLAGACIAPVAVSVLLFASARYQSDGSAALLLPFLLGIGMALPWPFAGAGLAVLPKPGKFMVTVKYIFAGFIFRAALWYAYLGWQLRPGVWSAEKEIRNLDSALADAASRKQRLIIDFQASWCKNCSAMEKILAEPEVAEKLRDFKVVPFRAENLSDPRISALLEKWQIPGLPAFVMLSLQE